MAGKKTTKEILQAKLKGEKGTLLYNPAAF
jgi:hypothetical protein